MIYLDIARAQLPVDEGRRPRVYQDTAGHLTIGVGRNLDAVGLHDDEIDLLFANDVHVADKTARALVPSFDQLTEERKAVLVNMAFNLGMRLGGFVHFLECIAAKRWDVAADAMLDSLWARQVGVRAKRLAEHMRGTP